MPDAALLAVVMSAAAAVQGPISYLALGDSYTIGESVEPSHRWPVTLARAMRTNDIALQDPRIIATTGWTTDELSDAMDAAGPLGEWDFVSLLIGVNDQYRGYPIERFRAAFSSLLERSISLARGRPGRVLVLTIPDWGVTPFGRDSGRDRSLISTQLDQYNAALREVCAARGVAVVDIAPVSRAHGAEVGMVAGDGLHPSAALYATWTELALPVARRLLSSEHSRPADAR